MLLIQVKERFLEILYVLRQHLIIRVEVVNQVLHEQDVVGLEGRQRPLPLRLSPPVLRSGLLSGGVTSHCCLRGLRPWLLRGVVHHAALSDLGLLTSGVSQLVV